MEDTGDIRPLSHIGLTCIEEDYQEDQFIITNRSLWSLIFTTGSDHPYSSISCCSLGLSIPLSTNPNGIHILF